MSTTFRTICTEEVMRATYPGETLYLCADCQRRVCLFADLDITSAGCDRFVCPACDAKRQTAPPAPIGCPFGCHCPACIRAATPEGYALIASWNAYADRRNGVTQ